MGKRTYKRSNSERTATNKTKQRAVNYYLAGETALQISERVRWGVSVVNSWIAAWRKEKEAEAVKLLEQGSHTYSFISAATGAPLYMVAHWNNNRNRRIKGLAPVPLKRQSKSKPREKGDAQAVTCLVCNADIQLIGSCAHCDSCGTSIPSHHFERAVRLSCRRPDGTISARRTRSLQIDVVA